MAIFFDCTYTRMQHGTVGITRVVRNLAKHLAQQLPAGQSFALIVASGDQFRLVDSIVVSSVVSGGGLEHIWIGWLEKLFDFLNSNRLRTAVVRYLPLKPQYVLWRLYSSWVTRVTRRLPRARISSGDIVILCDASWNYDVWSDVQLAKTQGAKIVTLVHDLIPITHPQFCIPLMSLVFRKWFKNATTLSDGIICNSMTTKQSVESYCRDVARCSVQLEYFRLGSDLDLKDARKVMRTEIEQFCKGKESSKIFLAVGSIEPRKNYPLILDAFESAWLSDPESLLVIVGRPSIDSGQTIERIHSHPRYGKQLFAFHDATDEELECLYRGAMALVFASAAEGFGLPVIEARQRGCLVLASDIPAFRELADGGVRFFALGDSENLTKAILEVLANPDLLNNTVMPVFDWKDSSAEFIDKVFTIVETSS